jgi:hypothetical protein
MQFSAIVLSAVALFGSMTFAAPAPAPDAELMARSSCQLGGIFGAGDAACSASVCSYTYLPMASSNKPFANRYTVHQGWNLPRRLLQRQAVRYPPYPHCLMYTD